MQSLESGQQFDYLFKCAGLELIAYCDLKEHHIITIIIKNHKGKFQLRKIVLWAVYAIQLFLVE